MHTAPDRDLDTIREREAGRLRDVYRSRQAEASVALRYPHRLASLMALHEKERLLCEEFMRRGLQIEHIDVLDVGCGFGGQIARFIADGADPTRLHGIDLRSDVVESARVRLPLCDIRSGDAGDMPFGTSSMDVVIQQTALSSILDERVRACVSAEMIRVCKSGGLIVSYDFVWNPTNAQTRGLGAKDLNRLFPGCTVTTRRVTLAPPLARWAAPRSSRLAAALGAMAPLRSHLLAFISPPIPRGVDRTLDKPAGPSESVDT